MNVKAARMISRFQTETSESAKRERLIAEGWITERCTKELLDSKANR